MVVGGSVRHKARPDWGLGEVEAVDDTSVRVRFGEDVKTFKGAGIGALEVTSEQPPARPTPRTRGQHSKVKCAACGGALRSGVVYREDKAWKSCPECSGNDGSEHVLLPYPAAFGTAAGRASEGAPDGAQSWCTACRPPKGPRNFATRRCSSLTPPKAVD